MSTIYCTCLDIGTGQIFQGKPVNWHVSSFISHQSPKWHVMHMSDYPHNYVPLNKQAVHLKMETVILYLSNLLHYV